MTNEAQESSSKKAYFIGPIDEVGTAIRYHAYWLLYSAVKPVLEAPEFAFSVMRADQDTSPGSISNALIN